MKGKEITGDIIVSNQPSDAEMRGLPARGIRSIINLRTGDSPIGPSPSEEAQLADSMGLAYVNLPMRIDNAGMADLDRLRENLASVPKPVLLHCRDGHRSAVVGIAATAAERGWNGAQAIEEARRMGLPMEGQRPERLVREYADARRGTTAEARTAAIEAQEPRSGVPPGGEPPRTQTK